VNPKTLAAIKRAREKRECEDERKFVDWARDEGCVCLKLNVRGNRDWPDQWVVGDMDDMLIEFKRSGKKPTPKQYELHSRLRLCKIVVSVDNFEEAKKYALTARLMLRWR
jgi:hypothetical protein